MEEFENNGFGTNQAEENTGENTVFAEQVSNTDETTNGFQPDSGQTAATEPADIETDDFTDTQVHDSVDIPADNPVNNPADTPISNPYYNFEKVNIHPAEKTADYKPMSKGLKVFAGIMALIIALTGSCAVGYFFGKNSNKSAFKKISVSLSAKPKNTDEKTAAEVYEIVNKSVVGITAYNKTGAAAQASGVIYSADGYIVTNDHIYAEIPAAKFKIYDYKGNEYDAKYVAGDTISDLSLLKIEKGSGFSVPDFGDSGELIYGENVVAVGRPNDARADSSITKGIISHTKRRMQTTSSYSATLIQTDSAINPGSSGGALVNMYGQIVGITSSKLAGVDYDSIGFAIPTVTMKRVVTQLASKGKVEDRAKLGISYQEITSVTKETGDYKSTGLLIAEVSEDSDLYGKAKEKDIITHVNGEKINRSDDILDVIEQSKAGDTISLTVLDSNGKSKDYKVKLKSNPGESSYSLSEKGFSDSESPTLPNPGGKPDGGTFDFPDGE